MMKDVIQITYLTARMIFGSVTKDDFPLKTTCPTRRILFLSLALTHFFMMIVMKLTVSSCEVIVLDQPVRVKGRGTLWEGFWLLVMNRSMVINYISLIFCHGHALVRL